jgi:hypothetical protein
MSDFFTRLAARTLGLAPTLQPIIAPIFAQEQPLRQTETDLFEFFAEEEASARNGDATRHDGHERQQHSMSQSMSVPSSEQSLASLPATASQDDRKGHPYILRADQQPVPMHKSSTPEPFQQESIPTVTREAHIVHEEIAVNGTIPEQKELFSSGNPGEQRLSEARSAHLLPPIERQGETPARTADHEGIEHRHTTVMTQQQGDKTMFRNRGVTDSMRTMPSPDNGGRASGDGRMPFVPSVVSRTTVQRKVEMPTEQKQSVQPVPTIQITIGRVEVRATPPSSVPTTQRQTPTPAVKSLDDYLRQREEGRVR